MLGDIKATVPHFSFPWTKNGFTLRCGEMPSESLTALYLALIIIFCIPEPWRALRTPTLRSPTRECPFKNRDRRVKGVSGGGEKRRKWNERPSLPDSTLSSMFLLLHFKGVLVFRFFFRRKREGSGVCEKSKRERKEKERGSTKRGRSQKDHTTNKKAGFLSCPFGGKKKTFRQKY